jgi:hypothetical protein
MHRPIVRPLLTLSLVALASACATKPGDRPEPVVIQVVNNLPLAGSLTVYITTGPSSKQLLGFVNPRDSAEFTFKPYSSGQYYRLIAQQQLKRPVISERFNLIPPQDHIVYWRLFQNSIVLFQKAPDSVDLNNPAVGRRVPPPPTAPPDSTS